MKSFADLQLLDTTDEKEFSGTTYSAFTAQLIGEDGPDDILRKTARFLKVKDNSDIIKKLNWLGFFSNRKIEMLKGTNADILVDMMIRKMSYAPLEKDMVIVHNEIVAEFPKGEEKRVSTLLVKGEPGGDSAMSRAVSLPAAIASKMILEGKINTKGVQRPTLEAIYRPVLKEMDDLGYRFKTKTIKKVVNNAKNNRYTQRR